MLPRSAIATYADIDINKLWPARASVFPSVKWLSTVYANTRTDCIADQQPYLRGMQADSKLPPGSRSQAGGRAMIYS